MGMTNSDSLDTKVQIANLYYKQNMSQQEIAEKMNISRTTVSRVLKSCIDEGIVSIHIQNISTYQYELENKLTKRYGLKFVRVVSSSEDYDMVIKGMAAAVDSYLHKIIKQNVNIGVSAGTTIESIIYQLNPVDNYNVDVFQMMGDASYQTKNCSSFLTIDLAKILRGVPHVMHVPLFVHTKVLRDLLLEEPFNKSHFAKLEGLDVALVGLGLSDSTLPEIGDMLYSLSDDKEMMEQRGIVGNICGVSINEEGNILEGTIQDRTIAMPIQNLCRIPDCIAVACGREKAQITRAAIKGKYINDLVIDESLACALLEN